VLDDDRAVLLHLPSARRVVLSPEATAVWQEIVAAGEVGVQASAITAALAPRYAAEPTTIDADVRNLLVELVDSGLVEAVDPTTQATGSTGSTENTGSTGSTGSTENELPADAAEAEQG